MSKIEYIIEIDSQGQNINVVGTCKSNPYAHRIEEEMTKIGYYVLNTKKEYDSILELWKFNCLIKKMVDTFINHFHIKQISQDRFTIKNIKANSERNININEFEYILQTLFNF